MGVVAIIFFLSIGVGIAWVFDTFVLQRNHEAIKLEGPDLLEMLKRSETYATLRGNQEVHSSRLGDRAGDRRDSLEQSREGGPGGRVLQLDPRRKVR